MITPISPIKSLSTASLLICLLILLPSSPPNSPHPIISSRIFCSNGGVFRFNNVDSRLEIWENIIT